MEPEENKAEVITTEWTTLWAKAKGLDLTPGTLKNLLEGFSKLPPAAMWTVDCSGSRRGHRRTRRG